MSGTRRCRARRRYSTRRCQARAGVRGANVRHTAVSDAQARRRCQGAVSGTWQVSGAAASTRRCRARAGVRRGGVRLGAGVGRGGVRLGAGVRRGGVRLGAGVRRGGVRLGAGVRRGGVRHAQVSGTRRCQARAGVGQGAQVSGRARRCQAGRAGVRQGAQVSGRARRCQANEQRAGSKGRRASGAAVSGTRRC
jgi:hypothetical protein